MSTEIKNTNSEPVYIDREPVTKKIGRVLVNVLVILLCCGYLFPIYMIFINSFKDRSELYNSIVAFPKTFTLEYYSQAMDKMNFATSLKNSAVITVVSIAIIIVLSSMTAWMIARVKSKLSVLIFGTLVATMLIPFQTIMMPLMQEMGWITNNIGFQMTDSIPGIVYMYIGFGAGMGVFLYHGFVSTIPMSLEEAAIIDGCNTWQTYWKIVFPLMKSTTMTVIILDVIWIWNDYLLPSLTLTSKINRTIPIATAKFFGQYTIKWNLAMAALMMTVVPVIIFYLCAQKYIIKGVAAGAVKG